MKEILTKAYTDIGLLFLRVTMGVMFVLHGWPKMIGGPEKWEKLGGAMQTLGIDFLPTFWGLMAALGEFGCGLLLAVGLLTRPSSAVLAFTMFVATMLHASKGDPFMHVTSRPLELMFVFIALALLGGGKYALDQRIFGTPTTDNDA